jgi:hypothetical protein
MSDFYPLLMSILFSNESINPLIYLNFGLSHYSLSLKTSKQKTWPYRAFFSLLNHVFIKLLYLLNFRHLQNERSLFGLDTFVFIKQTRPTIKINFFHEHPSTP